MESAAVVRTRTFSSLLDVSDRRLLAGLVALGAFVRFFLSALPLQTPFYLPDEYTYSAIARSIAETGRPAIRGDAAHFPALLEPLLAAPFWLGGNAELAYRLTQAEHSVAMSLAAVPAYLIARRVGLGSRFALGVAVLVLVSPNLLFGSLVVADPIAFPLVLGAVYAAVVAFDEPSRRAQLAVVGLVALATFARIQYVLLVPVFVVAALLVERGSLRRFAHSFGLATLAFALLGVSAAASGPTRVLGTYQVVFHLHAPVGTFLHQLGLHALLAPFAAGIVLVPGAAVGLARGVARPASRAECTLAAIASLFLLGLIGQAVFIGATISGNFGERYLFFAFPLLAIAFGLYAKRGGARGWACAIAGLLALLAMRFPLSHYTPQGADSTFLWAVARIDGRIGAGIGALIVSLAVVFLSGIAGYVAWRPKERASTALVAAIFAQIVVAGAATSWAIGVSGVVDRRTLPVDNRWVDHANVGHSTLVEPPGNRFGVATEQLLWNGSITRVSLLPGAMLVDPHTNVPTHAAVDGTLTTAGGPIEGPVLVDRGSTWTAFTAARLVRTTVGTTEAPFDLWKPVGSRVRLSAEAVGLRSDNWLMQTGWLTVWPARVTRRLTVRVSLPDPRAAVDAIHFTGAARGSFTVQPTQTRTVSFLIPAGTQPWTVHWSCDRYGYQDGVKVSFVSAPPKLTTVSGPID